MLVVDNRALLVSHNVVAMQAIAVLVEIIFAFRARKLLGRQDRFSDFARVGRARFVDRGRQNGDRIVRPGALVIRRELVGAAIDFAKSLRGFAGVFGVVGDAIGAVQGRTGQLG